MLKFIVMYILFPLYDHCMSLNAFIIQQNQFGWRFTLTLYISYTMFLITSVKMKTWLSRWCMLNRDMLYDPFITGFIFSIWVVQGNQRLNKHHAMRYHTEALSLVLQWLVTKHPTSYYPNQRLSRSLTPYVCGANGLNLIFIQMFWYVATCSGVTAQYDIQHMHA